MSVKTMTADAIRNDLRTIALTWPDGVPWQQLDRVNALKAELKRRNEPIDGPAGPPTPAATPLAAMTTAELESELRALSTRSDEASQARFADVRFEIRRRANDSLEAVRPARQAAPRALELPDEDEVELRRREDESRYAKATKKATAPMPDMRDTVVDDGASFDDAVLAEIADRPRRPTVPAPKTTARPLEKKPPATVCGYTATGREDGSVVLEYEMTTPNGTAMIAGVLEGDDADAFMAMFAAARTRARRMSAGE